MVRQLLGNIKGPKGEQGAIGPKGDRGPEGIPGERGTLANESIGVDNKLDITSLSVRGATASYNYDTDSGVINYSNIEWYLHRDVILNGVKHTFRVEDYTSNPAVRNGELILMVKDSGGEQLVYQSVHKKIPIVVDLTGRDSQVYTVELRVTNTELFSGFIEKPMLVEGDISVLWSPTSQTHYYLSANLSGDMPYSNDLTAKENLTILGTPIGWNSSTKELTLPGPGDYQIHVCVTPNTLNTGLIEVDLCNGNSVLTSVRGSAPNTVIVFGSVSTLQAVPRINVKVAQSIEETAIRTRTSQSTKILIKKLLK